MEAVYLRGKLALYYDGNQVAIECARSEIFTIIEYIERTRKVKVELLAA